MNSVSRKIKTITNILLKKYGFPYRPEKKPAPIDMLIGTILSQNTNDKNSYRAFINLKENFNSWEEVAALPIQKIEKLIKVAGLGKQKSKAIKNVLNSLLKKNKTVSLDYLNNKSDEEIIEELTSYSGVGVKTASCVLLFAMERNVCPVDTHVYRTVNRLGLVKAKTPDKTFELLQPNIPKNVAHSFHTNLIRLGREICKPTNPNCSVCPLIKNCEYENKNLEKVSIIKRNDFMLLDNIY